MLGVLLLSLATAATDPCPTATAARNALMYEEADRKIAQCLIEHPQTKIKAELWVRRAVISVLLFDDVTAMGYFQTAIALDPNARPAQSESPKIQMAFSKAFESMPSPGTSSDRPNEIEPRDGASDTKDAGQSFTEPASSNARPVDAKKDVAPTTAATKTAATKTAATPPDQRIQPKTNSTLLPVGLAATSGVFGGVALVALATVATLPLVWEGIKPSLNNRDGIAFAPWFQRGQLAAGGVAIGAAGAGLLGFGGATVAWILAAPSIDDGVTE